MIRCAVKDCLTVNRQEGLCKLEKIELNSRARCISFERDKEYLRRTLKVSLGFSADPETEAMVAMALATSYTPSEIAGEEEKTCHE